MNARDRDESVIRTLEQSHLDLLGAMHTEAERRHDALRLWQAKMERRYHVVSVALTLMVAGALAAGLVGGLLLSHQNGKVDGVVRAQAEQVASNTMRAAQVSAALCAVRDDDRARRAQTLRLLKSHPRGLAGVPAPILRATAANLGRTIEALEAVDCRK